MDITISSLSADDKVPGVYQDNRWGLGTPKAQGPLYCVVTGSLASSGASLTADQDISLINDDADARTKGGNGSEASLMAIAALETGATVIMAPVLAAGSAGTFTVDHTVDATVVSESGIEIDGKVYWYQLSTDQETCQDNLVAAINADPDCPFSAAGEGSDDYTVTLTSKWVGARVLSYLAKLNESKLAGSWSVTLAGGTPTSSGLVPPTAATGADDAEDLIALLTTQTYFRIAAAQSDATNAALWAAHVLAEADPLIEHLEQCVMAVNGTLTSAQSLTQTTLNSVQCQVLWSKNCKKHPSELAAKFAGIRAVYEGQNPHTRYDGTFRDPGSYLFRNISGQELADIHVHAENKAALNSGVTPVTMFGTDLRVARSICSHSLTGTNPDYRTLDTCDVTVPQRFRTDLAGVAQGFCELNPNAGDDPPQGAPPPPAGTATPSIWAAQIFQLMKDYEAQGYLDQGSVDAYPPTSIWNSTSNQIQSAVPLRVARQNHQLVNSVRQMAF
jgi:phage tail sheath gpL-like